MYCEYIVECVHLCHFRMGLLFMVVHEWSSSMDPSSCNFGTNRPNVRLPLLLWCAHCDNTTHVCLKLISHNWCHVCCVVIDLRCIDLLYLFTRELLLEFFCTCLIGVVNMIGDLFLFCPRAACKCLLKVRGLATQFNSGGASLRGSTH